MSAPGSPFVGLAAFTPRMAGYFTGRERFALTLAGAVLRSRVTVIYGQSGCGKSSVLGAALPQAMQATLHRAAAAQRAPFRLLHFRRWHPGFETRLFPAAAAKLAAPKGAGLAAAVAGWDRDREHKAAVILVPTSSRSSYSTTRGLPKRALCEISQRWLPIRISKRACSLRCARTRLPVSMRCAL
jgi:hypothetical protein